MDPNISEFSYGYALTAELIHWHGTTLTAAPVFPSLYQEGQAGGGYDLMLERPGLPLFIQFKLSDCMKRKNAQEFRDGTFTTTFYRMHIRPARHSKQHEMLLDLEHAGNEVYYAAPAFHTPTEFNEAYLQHQVRDRSLWIKPSAIGPLPDIEHHHVSFQVPGLHYVCSKPRRLETQDDFEAFQSRVSDLYRDETRTALTTEKLQEVADVIAEIGQKRHDMSAAARRSSREELKSRHPLTRIAFYASVFMDCQLFIVSEREPING